MSSSGGSAEVETPKPGRLSVVQLLQILRRFDQERCEALAAAIVDEQVVKDQGSQRG
jgi:hypothetical protein